MKQALSFGTLLITPIVMTMLIMSCGSGEDGGIDSPRLDLLTAIDQGKTDIVRQHMQSGTDPNKGHVPVGIPLEGAYPLHLAVVKGDKEIIQILLDNGAKLELKAKNKDEATPLSWAAFFGNKDMVELLVEFGASINAIDANNLTPLDAAYFAWALSESDEEKENWRKIMGIIKDNGGVSAWEIK